METEIKITADFNKALELLCEKIGIASDKILPHYIKSQRIRGVSLFVGNMLEIILPWLLFLHNPNSYNDLWLIGKSIICILFTYDGITDITNIIQKIFCPEADAIVKLLSDLQSFKNN